MSEDGVSGLAVLGIGAAFLAGLVVFSLQVDAADWAVLTGFESTVEDIMRVVGIVGMASGLIAGVSGAERWVGVWLGVLGVLYVLVGGIAGARIESAAARREDQSRVRAWPRCGGRRG